MSKDKITEKYTGEDELSQDVSLRHPNRNISKSENTFKPKPNDHSIETVNGKFAKDDSKTVAEELPGVLTKELFRELATYQSMFSISVFLGTHNGEVEKPYDPISFKNALQKASGMLKSKNVDVSVIETMMEPGYKLLRNDEFWLQPSPALALFIADGYFKYIKMPKTTMPDIIVEDTFYVTPLIPIIVSKEYFYLLVISKKQLKLFKGDAFDMEYIPVEGLPPGIGEESGDADVATTFRTGGGNNNDDKAYLANYLETADDVIWKKILHNENAPLLLAGVEYLIPVYREVCDYKYVWPDYLTGNHEHDDMPTLYKLAIEKMKPYFQQRINKALENYGNQSATSITSADVSEIIPATYYGRVSHLFVRKNEHIWGTFNNMTNELKFADRHAEGAQDLIDNAVVKTLLNGGEVFLLDADHTPAPAPLAAIFRY